MPWANIWKIWFKKRFNLYTVIERIPITYNCSMKCSTVYIYHTTKRNFKCRKRIKDFWDYRKSPNRINTSYLRNIKEAFIVSLINFFNQCIGNDRKRKFYFLKKYNNPIFSSPFYITYLGLFLWQKHCLIIITRYM